MVKKKLVKCFNLKILTLFPGKENTVICPELLKEYKFTLLIFKIGVYAILLIKNAKWTLNQAKAV